MCVPFTYKAKIRPGRRKSLGYEMSAASPFQLREPEILKGDQLLLQQFPAPAGISRIPYRITSAMSVSGN